jgi:hypothetical protein
MAKKIYGIQKKYFTGSVKGIESIPVQSTQVYSSSVETQRRETREHQASLAIENRTNQIDNAKEITRACHWVAESFCGTRT